MNLTAHHIDGETFAPEGREAFTRLSPIDGSLVHEVLIATAADVDVAVQSASLAQPSWARLRPLERGQILNNLVTQLREQLQELCDLEAADTGRRPDDVRGGIIGGIEFFAYYAGMASSLEGAQIDIGPDYHAYTRREPHGVVGVITPWNGPFNQAARAIAPALAVGNAVVVKPSEFTPATTLALARAATSAGVPNGILNVILGTGESTGSPLVAHPDVAKIAFTGSVATGRAIGRVAAEKIIPVSLELGGKSANIVLRDADLGKAVAGVASAFTYNAGQICIAGSRVLVERDIYDEFSRLLVQEVKSRAADIGPIITPGQFERIQRAFSSAANEGAELLTGGKVVPGAGMRVEPTLYADVTAEMSVYREEIFGPVACLIPFDDDDDAVRIANDSEYGLVAGVWTSNLSRAHRLAAGLEAGQILINEYLGEHVEVPFGGWKSSGVGSEKGRDALSEYTRGKSIVVRL